MRATINDESQQRSHCLRRDSGQNHYHTVLHSDSVPGRFFFENHDFENKCLQTTTKAYQITKYVKSKTFSDMEL